METFVPAQFPDVRMVSDWGSEALSRFDRFNVDLGAKPALFKMDGRTFSAAVRTSPKSVRSSPTSRNVEILDGDVLAGFALDLNFEPLKSDLAFPVGLLSGDKGWIGVYNYPGIAKEMPKVRGATFSQAFEEYRKRLAFFSDVGDDGESFHFLDLKGKCVLAYELMRHLEETGRTEHLEETVKGGCDYSSALLGRKLFEAVYLFSPPDTKWTLFSIGHRRTVEQLCGADRKAAESKAPKGRPFDETGFGYLAGESGWQWTEGELEGLNPGAVGMKALKIRLSPVVRRKPGQKPAGWLADERFR